MKQIVVVFLFISSITYAQDLKLVKATKQTINSGASPTSTTNYMIQLKKLKKCKWSIDSVVNVSTQKSVDFNVVKVDDPTVLSPNYKQVKASEIKERGMYQITFASRKNRGGGRPGAPLDVVIPVADFTQGAIVFYRIGKKKKQLLIESFEQLETVNAP